MVLCVLNLLLATGAVTAQAPAPANEASALFDKARAAFKAGNFAEACPAFEQSYTLDPALGTLLNWGVCLEKQGRFASAWLRFNDAVGWAQRTHEADREAYARKLSTDLKPKVSWLAISSVDDVDVKLDLQTLRVTPTPISVPIDPGLHALTVEKPGYEKWAATVDIVQPGTIVQKVPQLKPASLSAALPPLPAPPIVEAKDDTNPWAGPPPQPPPEPSVASPGAMLATKASVPVAPGSSRGAGVALIVGGGVAAVAGAIGLGWSLSTYSALQNQRINMLPPATYVPRGDFETLKWAYPVSWVAVGAGAAAIIGGAVLVAKKQPVVVAPAVGPTGASMTVSGQF